MWKTRAKNLKEAILETIAWFSIFLYPPTALEVWRFSFSKTGYEEILGELRALVNEGRLVCEDGKYTLAGREEAFVERERRYRYALPKLRRAERAAAWLSRVSDIRGIFLCNTLGLMHAREDSDIDMFVIAKSGTIWRARFLAVTPYALLGKRPASGSERDTMCWSFFLSDSDLDLRRFALPDHDPYLAFWAATLLPLYDPSGLLQQLREQSGITELFPQFAHVPVIPTRASHGWFRLPDFFERVLRGLQERRFPAAIRERVGQGSDVVVSDDALKFHTNDRRIAYREEFEAKLRELGL